MRNLPAAMGNMWRLDPEPHAFVHMLLFMALDCTINIAQPTA